MREILFRGKRIDNGEWVEGYVGSHSGIESLIMKAPYLAQDGSLCAIRTWEVEPDTVGQYTGLTDNNGVKIFEGDIVHCVGGYYLQGYYEHDKEIHVKDIADGTCIYIGEFESVEVIGNINDNPELMEGDNK